MLIANVDVPRFLKTAVAPIGLGGGGPRGLAHVHVAVPVRARALKKKGIIGACAYFARATRAPTSTASLTLPSLQAWRLLPFQILVTPLYSIHYHVPTEHVPFKIVVSKLG